MSSNDHLSDEDKKFLAECEEEFKDRFTDKDEEFMKVFSSQDSNPPIIECWRPSQNSGHRNNRFNRRDSPYQHHNRGGNFNDRRNDRSGYDNYDRRNNDRRYGGHDRRPRY